MVQHEIATGSESSLTTFVYEGNPVSFKTIDQEVFINATEMAKRFGKRPAEWLRLPATVSFLEAISCMGKSHTSVIQTVMGSPETGGGTWLQEIAAIEFARWLNPMFSIWCNTHIRDLMRHGITATPQKIEEMLADPDALIAVLTNLKQERLLRQQAEQRAQLAGEQLAITETVVKEQAPKVQYYDKVMQSKDVFAIDVIASDLGLTAVKLNRFLAERGVQYKQQGCWVLTAKYRNQGLTRTKIHTFDRSNGEKGSSQHMYWTEKGKELIYKLYSTATNAKSIK